MEARGYTIENNILYQDNKSTILLAKNGRMSAGKNGAMMSMGKGATVNISRKHKLNTGSSTEAELVSIAEVLGMMMW